MGTAFVARKIVKTYPVGDGVVVALDRVNLAIEEGDFVAVCGRSGSGKSTLLNLLGGRDRPTSGSVRAGGRDLNTLSDAELLTWRRGHVGMVAQDLQVSTVYSVVENVLLPMHFADTVRFDDRHGRACALLERVGIRELADRRPDTLSAGQLQRVAIACALANEPTLLLADEPTGNLDRDAGNAVLDLFADLNDDGRTVVLASHEPSLQAVVKRRLTLMDGRVVGDERIAAVSGSKVVRTRQ